MSKALYVNDWGIAVRGYESRLGGLYHNENAAHDAGAGALNNPVHALVRFHDVYYAYEALEHILQYDADGLGAIGLSLARSALKNSSRRGSQR